LSGVNVRFAPSQLRLTAEATRRCSCTHQRKVLVDRNLTYVFGREAKSVRITA
jgi:hypothetical protein